MSILEKEMKNENIMLLIGIILFIIMAFIKGISWAVETIIMIFLAVTLYDWIKTRLNRFEKPDG